jgi:hypothetical protein
MYFDKHKLLHAKKSLDDENTQMYSALYAMFIPVAKRIKDYNKNMLRSIGNCTVKSGLYNDHPENNTRYNSHDNYTSIAAWSKHYGFGIEKEIWNYAKRAMFTYDNISGQVNRKRIIHPRDLIFLGICGGSIVANALKPVLSIAIIMSFLKTKKVRYEGHPVAVKRVYLHTDGKVLHTLKMKALNMKLTWAICSYIMRKKKDFGSMESAFDIYFPADHPLRGVELCL